MPFFSLRGERPAEVLLGLGAAVLALAVTAVGRDLLPAGLAGVMRIADAAGLFAADVRVVLEPERPAAVVFARADAVLRVEDGLDLRLLAADDRETSALAEILLAPALRAEALRAEVRLFPPVILFAVLLLLEPRALVELFLDDEEAPDDRLLFVLAAPFLPVVLFFAAELRDELLVERELEAFLAPPVDRELEAFLAPPVERELVAFLAPPVERELEAFLAPVVERELVDFLAPPLVERELDPEEFLAPPDEERDDDELFFDPTLLLELDDEREPLDFFVVAMQIFPPVVFGMILHEQNSAIFVPFVVCIKLRQISRSTLIGSIRAHIALLARI